MDGAKLSKKKKKSNIVGFLMYLVYGFLFFILWKYKFGIKIPGFFYEMLQKHTRKYFFNIFFRHIYIYIYVCKIFEV